MKTINNCVVLLQFALLVSASKERHCGVYEENWRIALCAGSLKKDGLISDNTFIDYLNQAIIATAQDITSGQPERVENKNKEIEEKEPREEGMTIEDMKQANDKHEKEKENRKQRYQSKLVRTRHFEVFEYLIKPWLPNYLNRLVYYITYDTLQFVDREYVALVAAIILIMIYIFVAYMAHCMCGFFPPLLYMANIMAYPESRIIAIALLVIWCFRRCINLISRPKETAYWERFNKRHDTRNWQWLETCSAIGVLIGVRYITHHEEYGQFAGVWVLTVVSIGARLIPGVRADSTIGALMVVLLALIGFLTIS